MNVGELYNLTEWIEEEITKKGVVQKYTDLSDILEQISQNQRQPLEQPKDDLIEALSSVRLETLTRDQFSFLEKMGIAPLVGKDGADEIENVLFRNSLDIDTATQKMQEMTANLSKAVEKSKEISSGLKDYIEEYEISEEDLGDGVMIRVSFLGDAAMQNIIDLKKWGNDWHAIGRGIAMAHGKAPDKIKIVGASKGSVIIELLADPVIASTIGGIILWGLTVAEKILNIRKQIAEIKNLKFKDNNSTQKIVDELIQAEQSESENIVKNAVEEVVEELKLDPKNGDGDKIIALTKSIEKLIGFVGKGGEVDCVVPDDEESEDEAGEKITRADLAQLRTTFEEVRKLEHTIKLLKHAPDEDVENINDDQGEEGNGNNAG